MNVSNTDRARALAISKGLVEPQNGMERHFLKVCRGQAIPVTAEEREWHRVVTDAFAEEQRRLTEQIESAVQDRLAAETQGSQATAAAQNLHIEHLESIVSQQQELLQSLLKEKEYLKSQIKIYERETAKLNSPQKSICTNCGGDGGAKGECYKCDGTGWIDA